jgi:hypothetical protein
MTPNQACVLFVALGLVAEAAARLALRAAGIDDQLINLISVVGMIAICCFVNAFSEHFGHEREKR